MNGIDRDLGMGRPIGRRDFVNGTAVALGASLLPKWSWALALDAQAAGQGAAIDPYPPRRTGMRGSHEGSFEVAHQMRDGRPWTWPGRPTPASATTWSWSAAG